MRIGIVCDNRRFRDAAEPFAALRKGLETLGHEVEVLCPSPACRLGGFARPPQALFLWNGQKGLWKQLADQARRSGLKVFVMERGFFDRLRFTQIDPAGFNHTASWARRETFDAPPPPQGQARFVGAYGRQPQPLAARRDGYLLLLLQIAGDSQLAGCELHHPLPLVQAVEDAAPVGLEIRLRPHPLSSWQYGCAGRAKMAQGSLDEALAGARFAVTINSNAGNEALAAGCPVLALGPALYTIAALARRTSLFDLPAALSAMADGELGLDHDDPPAAVRNYLFHLACRQVGRDELAEGKFLARLLQQPM